MSDVVRVSDGTKQSLQELKDEYQRLTGVRPDFDLVIRALQRSVNDDYVLKVLRELERRENTKDDISEFDELFSL